MKALTFVYIITTLCIIGLGGIGLYELNNPTLSIDALIAKSRSTISGLTFIGTMLGIAGIINSIPIKNEDD